MIALGVERVQRGFEPLRRQVELWRESEVPDRYAKEVIYDAFLLENLAPRHLLPLVHRHYFAPAHGEFAPRTLWSLSNAFTSAFHALKPVRYFQATAKLGGFLARRTDGLRLIAPPGGMRQALPSVMAV